MYYIPNKLSFLCFLDEISEYFGVKIGMYFAWLGHYTTALSIPAFVGFLFWVYNWDIFRFICKFRPRF